MQRKKCGQRGPYSYGSAYGLHGQGMTPRDIAAKTGVSRQTVYKHLTAGGARLRRKTADLDLLCGKIGLRYGRVRAELMAEPMELADYVLSRAPKAQTFAEALVQIAKEAYLQK